MTDKTETPAPVLTDVDHVGAKTAKALAAAGIDSVAALAAVDLANPPALTDFRGTPAWTDWVAAAKTLVAAQTPPAADTPPKPPLTPEQASVIASAAASEDEQKDGPGQPHPAGAPPMADDPYDGPVLVVTGPKKGFRRAGFAFNATPRTLSPADFGEGIEAARRFIALYREPKLTVTLRAPDGSLIEFNEGDIAALETALADPDTDEGRAILEQFGHLTAAA
ncbi:helix-hairpin-helix domain-containing protein [Citromicrobium bathyomarinum]